MDGGAPNGCGAGAGPPSSAELRGILEECIGISDFLSRFVVEDGDDVLVEGLQLSLQDMDDPNRLVHFVRFRCKRAEELGFHLEELRLGNPYTRKLVRDEMMVQETYDFFILLQQMRHEMPAFIRLSPGLEAAIEYAIGGIREAREGAEDEEEPEAVSTESDEWSEGGDTGRARRAARRNREGGRKKKRRRITRAGTDSEG